jgi:hypothetical protein
MKLTEVQKYAEKQDKNHQAGKDFLNQVKVKHRDGSIFKLRFAKAEILEIWLIVYTEHNGILYFHCEDILYAKEAKLKKKSLKRGKYVTWVDNNH